MICSCQIGLTLPSDLVTMVLDHPNQSQIDQYVHVKIQKDIADERLSFLQTELKLVEERMKRIKARSAKYHKKLIESRGSLKQKDQHIKNLWKMILSLGCNHDKNGLSSKDKSKLKQEFVKWFPSESTLNKKDITDAIDKLEDIQSPLHETLTSSKDISTCDKIGNIDEPNESSLSSSMSDKVTSSYDSAERTPPSLPNETFTKLENRSKKKLPCSQDSLSQINNENTKHGLSEFTSLSKTSPTEEQSHAACSIKDLVKADKVLSEVNSYDELDHENFLDNSAVLDNNVNDLSDDHKGLSEVENRSNEQPFSSKDLVNGKNILQKKIRPNEVLSIEDGFTNEPCLNDYSHDYTSESFEQDLSKVEPIASKREQNNFALSFTDSLGQVNENTGPQQKHSKFNFPPNTPLTQEKSYFSDSNSDVEMNVIYSEENACVDLVRHKNSGMVCSNRDELIVEEEKTLNAENINDKDSINFSKQNDVGNIPDNTKTLKKKTETNRFATRVKELSGNHQSLLNAIEEAKEMFSIVEFPLSPIPGTSSDEPDAEVVIKAKELVDEKLCPEIEAKSSPKLNFKQSKKQKNSHRQTDLHKTKTVNGLAQKSTHLETLYVNNYNLSVDEKDSESIKEFHQSLANNENNNEKPTFMETTSEEKHPVQNLDSSLKTDFTVHNNSKSVCNGDKVPTCIEDIISSIKSGPSLTKSKVDAVENNLDQNGLCSNLERVDKLSKLKKEASMAESKIDEDVQVNHYNLATSPTTQNSLVINDSKLKAKSVWVHKINSSQERKNYHLAYTFDAKKRKKVQEFKKNNASTASKKEASMAESKIDEDVQVNHYNLAISPTTQNSLVINDSKLKPKSVWVHKINSSQKRKNYHLAYTFDAKKRKKVQEFKKNNASTASNDKTLVPSENAQEGDCESSGLGKAGSLACKINEENSSNCHLAPKAKTLINKTKRMHTLKLERISKNNFECTDNPIEKLFETFKDNLCEDHLKNIVHSLVKLLLNQSSFPNKAVLLYHVFNYLRHSKCTPLTTFALSEDQSVLLPFVEKCIVVALFRIELKKITYLDGLLETAVTTLYNLILTKDFQMCGVASLCRVLTEICKRLGDSLKPVLLSAELLKTRRAFSSYLIASIASVWKELFYNNNTELVEQKLLHSSILYGACKKKPKRLFECNWNSSMNIFSKCFNAPPVNDAKTAIHVLKEYIQAKCQNGAWKSDHMRASLTILAIHEDWSWVKENVVDTYILPNLEKFGKTTLNEAAFDLYCKLYVDIHCVKPQHGKHSFDNDLSNIYNSPEVWQGKFVKDCVALSLIRLNYLKNQSLPLDLNSWFQTNHQNPKVLENLDIFNRKLMLTTQKELLVEEIL